MNLDENDLLSHVAKEPTFSLKRNILPTPGGLKAIYNLTDGTFVAEISVYAAGKVGKESIPQIISDLGEALVHLSQNQNP